MLAPFPLLILRERCKDKCVIRYLSHLLPKFYGSGKSIVVSTQASTKICCAIEILERVEEKIIMIYDMIMMDSAEEEIDYDVEDESLTIWGTKRRKSKLLMTDSDL